MTYWTRPDPRPRLSPLPTRNIAKAYTGIAKRGPEDEELLALAEGDGELDALLDALDAPAARVPATALARAAKAAPMAVQPLAPAGAPPPKPAALALAATPPPQAANVLAGAATGAAGAAGGAAAPLPGAAAGSAAPPPLQQAQVAAALPPPSAGDLLDMALAAAAGAPGGGPPGATTGAAGAQQAPASRDPAVTRLLTQLEARMRAAEQILYTSLFVPSTHQAITDAGAAQAAYKVAAQANPMGHGLGGQEGLCSLALLRGTLLAPLQLNADAGLVARKTTLALVYARIRTLTPIELGELFPHCITATLDGNRLGWSLLVAQSAGRVTLASDPAALGLCQAAEAAGFDATTTQALAALSTQYFIIDQGEFVPVVAPGINVIKIISALLSSSGATRTPGRAPPGALVRNVRGKGGKGRGK